MKKIGTLTACISGTGAIVASTVIQP